MKSQPEPLPREYLADALDRVLQKIKLGYWGVDEPDLDGRTALHLACELGSLEKVEEILKLNADINVQPDHRFLAATNPYENPTPPLIHAYWSHHLDVVKYLIEQKADIHSAGFSGMTLLHYVMLRGDLELTQFLIAKGANINQRTFAGGTAVSEAVREGRKECIEYVLPLLDDVAHEDLQGRTLLHLALDKHNEAIAKILSQHPSAREIAQRKDIYGRTAIEMAITEGFDEVIIALSDLSPEEFTQYPNYNSKIFSIAQSRLEEKIERYSKGNFLGPEGNCNGLAYLAAYEFSLGKEKEFFADLKTIASWNPDEIPLDPLQPTQALSSPARALRNLFERWINEVAWLQHDDKLKELSLLKPIETLKKFQYVSERKFEQKFKITFYMTREQLVQLLEYIRQFADLKVILGGMQHATFLHVTPDHNFKYYDSNFVAELPVISSAAVLADIIERTKYRALFYAGLAQEKMFTEIFKDYQCMALSFEGSQFSSTVSNDQMNEIDPAISQLDEEFIYQFLNATNALVKEGLYTSLIDRTIESALNEDSPQSLRAILRYVNYDKEHVLQARNDAYQRESIACYLAILDNAALLPPTFQEIKGDRKSKFQHIFKLFNQEPNIQNGPIFHAFISAIERNDPQTLSILLSRHTLIEDDLQRVVQRAVFLEQSDCVKILMELPNVSVRKEYLQFAEKFGNQVLLSILEKANPKETDKVSLSKSSLFIPSPSIDSIVQIDSDNLSPKKAK